MTDTDSDIYGRIADDHTIVAQDKAERPQFSAPGNIDIGIEQFGQPEQLPNPTTDAFASITERWLCAYNDDDVALVPYNDDYFRAQASGGIRLDLPRTAISHSGASYITASNLIVITPDQIPIEHTRLLGTEISDDRPHYELTTSLQALREELQLNTEDGSVTHFSQRYARLRDTSSRDSPGPNGTAELYIRCQDLEVPPEYPDTMYSGIPINLADDTTAATWTDDETLDRYVATPTEITVVDESQLPSEIDMPDE